MTERPLLTLLAAVAVCAALPGYGQVVRPDPTQPGGFPLKPGSATALIQEKCIACHDLRRVVNANKDAAEWRETVFMMKAAGAQIDDVQAKQISDYFVANYLGLERPKPVVVAGPANVRFKVWDTPTPGSRPHDPLATPDGMIWWSGQFANRLGRLNPATGETKEFPIPVRGGPHGLINDKDGNIWYAGNWGGHIGKLDPKTGEWKQYSMPDPNVKDPHTPLFDKDGILWFSAQNAGVMGRLDPKTGDIKLFRPVGAPGQQPYALRFLSDRRQPWFSYFGSNKIATINPDTLELKEYVLPDSKTRIRRMDVTSDDMIWFGDWSNGKLVRFDPKTGDQGVRGTGRTARATLWHGGDRRHHLVLRVEPAAEHARALRPQDREVPDLGDAVWRGHRSSHGEDARRKYRDGAERGQQDRARGDPAVEFELNAATVTRITWSLGKLKGARRKPVPACAFPFSVWVRPPRGQRRYLDASLLIGPRTTT